MSKQQLREAAVSEGYFPDGGEGAGRATHLTLVNIKRAGRVHEIGPDQFVAPIKSASNEIQGKLMP